MSAFDEFANKIWDTHEYFSQKNMRKIRLTCYYRLAPLFLVKIDMYQVIQIIYSFTAF